MHGPSCPAVYAPMSDRPVADREPLTLENLGERLSLLSRFATSTGDYVDIEAVLDEWRMTIDAALAQPAVPVAGAEHCGDPTPHEPHDDEGTATGALFVHTCPGSLALRAAQPEDDGLDAAWKEAEAALPEGWHFEIWRTMSGGALGYGIEADAIDPILGGPVLVAGPTPAAALRALAARLSESSEGVERREPQRVALDEIDIHDG